MATSDATYNASQARARLPELLDRVEAGEEVAISRHGKPVAVVVRPDALRVRREAGTVRRADALRDALAAARRSTGHAGRGLDRERADALIAEIRSGRDGR
ncbi:MAG: type II toxin-antitoxin system prevent-host-death family antitoxin [Solirubrobacteraceae bacterium]|nr:type II toxin-antitoxin system prevent-host-death family antitoxin [Solirubrobacteraceae bacterium]